MNYSIVLVKHDGSDKLYAFKAPRYKVNEGDKVLADTMHGIKEGTVEKVFAMPDRDLLEYLQLTRGELKKVVAIIEPIDYEDKQ